MLLHLTELLYPVAVERQRYWGDGRGHGLLGKGYNNNIDPQPLTLRVS